MSLEQRAAELDEARRLKIIKSDSIDVEKYLHAHDVTIKVKQARDFLDSIKENYLSTVKDTKILLPWTNTHNSFAFRPGEVTVYAGSNGGGKSLLTG